MKHKKIITLFLVCLVVCSIFSVSVFAVDEVVSTDGSLQEGEVSEATPPLAESSVVAAQDVTSPTTNIYYIIDGMWNYFLPQNVIADNAGIIAFYNIGLTALFALAPFILIFKFLFRKK